VQHVLNAKTQRRKGAGSEFGSLSDDYFLVTLIATGKIPFASLQNHSFSSRDVRGMICQRNGKQRLRTYSSDIHSSDISGFARKPAGRRKNVGKKISCFYALASIFLHFHFRSASRSCSNLKLACGGPAASLPLRAFALKPYCMIAAMRFAGSSWQV
jgi:hypothetical protein